MGKRLNLNINPLVALLATFFVCGKNAVYKAHDYSYRLIQSAIEHRSLEAMYKLTGYLSADRVLNKIHAILHKQMQQVIVDFTQNIKLPKKVMLAIDFTDKIYYGDKNHPNVMGSKGGDYVRRYIELSTVKPALFINAVCVDQLTNVKHELLTQLLEGFFNIYTKTKIQLLLLDRGFFSKEVVALLIEKSIPFIMPAIKNKAIGRLVKQFEKGEIDNRIRYMFGKSKVTLLFIKMQDETLVYMTNTKYSRLQVHQLYRKRWQIETNFREQNNFIFKTTTQNFAIRYLAFVLAGLLFNAWQLARNTVPYSLESYIFKQIVTDSMLKVWSELTGRRVVKKLDYLLVA